METKRKFATGTKRKIPAETKRKNVAETKKEEGTDIFSASSFSNLGLDESLCKQLEEWMGFKSPTQVQAQAIPVILSGRHVLVNAATGTGKTITYLAPIIHLLLKIRLKREEGTFALVLVPTHELCMQVYEILRKILLRYRWIVPGYIMGGENRSKEKARLRKGVTILIATPGRLLDHLKNTSSFTHTNLRWIIFDEADRILELGYGKDIEEILNILNSKKDDSVSNTPGFQRQNLLLSATLNEKVNHLANMSLENPVLVGMGNKSSQSNPPNEHRKFVESDVDDESNDLSNVLTSSDADYNLPSQLVQRFVKVPCGSRLTVLLSVLKYLFENEASQKVVVFFSTCDAVDFHFSLLSQFHWSSKSEAESELKQKFLRCKTFRLHGKMKHEDRRTTFQAFKTEKMSLLLSTDVSARGLDFPEVRCIVQYDSPGEATEYVHRVGRTARMGARGESLLFLQPVEIDYLHDLQKHGVSLSEYPLLKVLDTFPVYSQQPHAKKETFIDMHPWCLIVQKSLESFVASDPTMKKLAKDAFCSWVRAYTAHRGELKRIFMVKKLHLGHVAKSFALKDQPSLVGRTFQTESKKRKKDERQYGQAKRKKVSRKP